MENIRSADYINGYRAGLKSFGEYSNSRFRQINEFINSRFNAIEQIEIESLAAIAAAKAAIAEEEALSAVQLEQNTETLITPEV